MSVTQEPRGLTWINNVNMATFGSLISQVCWLIGSVVFTGLACYLMTRVDFYDQVGAVVEGTTMRQMVLISRETMRQLGNTLALALLAAWTGKTVAGVFDSNNKRKTHPAYAEVLKAEAEGKVSGAAAAAVISEKAADAKAARTTREHPALSAIEEVKKPSVVNIENAEKVEVPADPAETDDQVQWADGRRGLL